MYALNFLEITQNTSYDAQFSAFESFFSDGKVNDTDMYFLREHEDFSPEADFAVMSKVEKYAASARGDRVIDAPETDYMLTA